jgi:hypothetical protein
MEAVDPLFRMAFEIDGVFRCLLQTIDASDMTEIAPYD